MSTIRRLIGEAEDIWPEYDSEEDAVGKRESSPAAILYYLEAGISLNEDEINIASVHAELAYVYAWSVLQGRFRRGEPVIAESPEFAFKYAENVLGGTWSSKINEGWLARKAERSIDSDPVWRRAYEKEFTVI